MFNWLIGKSKKDNKKEKSLNKKTRKRVKEKNIRVSISVKKEENRVIELLAEKLEIPNSHLWRLGAITIGRLEEEEIRKLLEKIE